MRLAAEKIGGGTELYGERPKCNVWVADTVTGTLKKAASRPPQGGPQNTGLISLELPHVRIEIHGGADPVMLGIFLKCRAP